MSADFGDGLRATFDFSRGMGFAICAAGDGAEKGGGVVVGTVETGAVGAGELACEGVTTGSVRFSIVFSFGRLKLVGGAVKWGLERTGLASVLVLELAPL